MRILHLGKFYSPIEGGIESINRFVVEAMKGNIQRIISFNNSGITVEDDVDSVPVIRTSSQGIVASQPLSLKYFSELRRNIKMFHPDVIHFHYPNPLGALYLLLSIRSNNKLIVHWHSDVIAQRFLHKIIAPIENLLLKKADYIIATSPNYRDNSEALRNFKNKVKVIPCSINESNFELTDNDSIKIKEIINRYNNKPIIFFIGRHVEYKGIRYLLEAEKFIKSDCIFLIAGRGPLTNELKKEFKSDRIHWIGRLCDEEMKQYYSAASIFAFPSITKNEAFGVVLAESMYCGSPAVTFTIEGSGVNWVSIKNETCLEVPNRDSKAYAEAIDILLNDKFLIDKLSENSKKRAQKLFTKEIVAKQYRDLYNEILKSK